MLVASYFIHYDTLLHNKTDIITKWHFLSEKYDQSLLQNASGFLLKYATVLLQNTTGITKRDDFITKCESYYKMRYLLQNVSVQSSI